MSYGCRLHHLILRLTFRKYSRKVLLSRGNTSSNLGWACLALLVLSTKKVFDSLADVTRALKLILRDRTSTVERLKREYGALRQLPPRENVVKVIDADFLPGDGPPFLVFDYIDGLDVGEMIDSRLFTPPDGLRLAREVAEGIRHLHEHGVYHCDIKPRNLIWTEHGTKVVNFNVSVVAGQELSHGGGSRRYLPPRPGLIRNSDRGRIGRSGPLRIWHYFV